MNNKGFTLIELIATIALLAIIAVISFISINAVVNDNKVSNCKNLVNSIEISTKEYISDNRYDLDNIELYKVSNKKYKINASVLIDAEYLTSYVINDSGNIMLDNPFSDEDIEPSTVSISIELNDDYTVKSVTIMAPEILETCENE